MVADISKEEALRLLDSFPNENESVKDISPEEAKKLLGSFPEEPGMMQKVGNAIKNFDLVGFVNDMGDATRQSLEDFVVGAENLASRGISELTGKNLPTFKPYDYDSHVTNPIAKGAGIVASNFFLPPIGKLAEGLEQGASTAMRLVPYLKNSPKLVNAVSKVMAGAGTGAGLGATYGAAVSPEDAKLGAIVGAPLGAAAEGVAPVLESAGKLVRGNKYSPLTLAQAAGNKVSEAISGLKDKWQQGLGEKQVENIPLALFKEKVQPYYEEIKGTNKFGEPIDVSGNRFNSFGTSSRDSYRQVDELGAQEQAQKSEVNPEFKFDRSKFDHQVDSVLDNLTNEKERLKDSPASESVDQAIKFFQRTKNTRVDTFGDASDIRKDLNQVYKNSNYADNYYITKNIKSLKDAARAAQEDNAEGLPQTVAAHKKADEFFQRYQLPFEQDVSGKASPFVKTYEEYRPATGKLPEQIPNSMDTWLDKYLVKGSSDRVNQLKSLQKILPDQESKDWLKAYWFRRTKTSEEFIKRFGELSEPMQKELFQEDYSQLKQMHDLYEAKPEVFKGDNDLSWKEGAAIGVVRSLATGNPKHAIVGAAVPALKSISTHFAPAEAVNQYIQSAGYTAPGVQRYFTPRLLSKLLHAVYPTLESGVDAYAR